MSEPLTSNCEDIPDEEISLESIAPNSADGASVVVVVVVVGVKMDPKNIPVAMPNGRAIKSNCRSCFSILDRLFVKNKVSSVKIRYHKIKIVLVLLFNCFNINFLILYPLLLHNVPTLFDLGKECTDWMKITKSNTKQELLLHESTTPLISFIAILCIL